MANYSITLTASGNSHYIFNGSDKNGSLVNREDPAIYVDENDTITFTFNQGAGMHPFLIEKGSQSFGSYVGGDPSATWTASESGTWTYRCTSHPAMAGSIIVAAAVTTSTTPDPNAADYTINITYSPGEGAGDQTFTLSGTDRNGAVSGTSASGGAGSAADPITLTFNENDKVDFVYDNSADTSAGLRLQHRPSNFDDIILGGDIPSSPFGLSSGTHRFDALYWVTQTTVKVPSNPPDPQSWVTSESPLGRAYGVEYIITTSVVAGGAQARIRVIPDSSTTAPPTTAAPTPTTAAPTPTTAAPTPTTAAPTVPAVTFPPTPPDALGLLPQAASNIPAIRAILDGIYIHSKSLIYNVTVKQATNTYGTGDKFHINNVDCPPLTLFRGQTYVFELNDKSLDRKNLAFFATPKIPGESKLNRDTEKLTEGITYYGTAGGNNSYLILLLSISTRSKKSLTFSIIFPGPQIKNELAFEIFES